MPILYYVQNSIIGIILVSIILFYVLGQGGRRQAQDSLFVALLLTTLLIIVLELGVDLLSGKTFYGSRILLTFFTFWFYVVNPLPGALYLLYLDQLRRRWVRVPRGIGFVAFTPLVIACILIVVSLFNGIIFPIDTNNVYQRGPLFFFIIIADYLCMGFGFIYLLLHRNTFKERDFSFFMFFPLPILLGSLLQVRHYGIEITGLSLAVTLLIVYLHMQNSQANKDYLTKLYNRNLSEQYLQNLISHQKKTKSIGGILLDINDFKEVNDIYGHDLGDQTLRYFSQLLVDSFGGAWFIARHGGDEFILVREGTTQQELEEDLVYFDEQLALSNATDDFLFAISVSIGAALYEDTDATDGTSFIKALDELMYQNKRAFHCQKIRDQVV